MGNCCPYISNYVVEIAPAGSNNYTQVFSGLGDNTRNSFDDPLPVRMRINRISNSNPQQNVIDITYSNWLINPSSAIDIRIYTTNFSNSNTPQYLVYNNVTLNNNVNPPDEPLIRLKDNNTFEFEIEQPSDLGDGLNSNQSNLSITYDVIITPTETFGKTDGANVPLDTTVQSYNLSSTGNVTDFTANKLDYNNRYRVDIQAKNDQNENSGPVQTSYVNGPTLSINYFNQGDFVFDLSNHKIASGGYLPNNIFLNYDIISFDSIKNSNINTAKLTQGINALEAEPTNISMGKFKTRIYVSGLSNNYTNCYLIGDDSDYNDVVYSFFSDQLNNIANEGSFFIINETNYSKLENIFITADRQITIKNWNGMFNYIKNNLLTLHNGGEIIGDKFNHPLLFKIELEQEFRNQTGSLINSTGTPENGSHTDDFTNTWVFDSISNNSTPSSSINSEIMLDFNNTHYELVLGLPIVTKINYNLEFNNPLGLLLKLIKNYIQQLYMIMIILKLIIVLKI